MTYRVLHNRFEIATKNGTDVILGKGAMGIVYLGTDQQTGEKVAIKLLHAEYVAEHPDLVARFKHEGEALRKLNHPNIVKMLDAFQEGNQHYLVMEYLGGGSLEDILAEEGGLAVKKAVNIALDLADALTRAHRLKIFHRDIKPANVMLADDGTPRLTDFGVARIHGVSMTQTGMIVGTLSYMSPEALSGDDANEQTDIWAFGAMLYEIVMGQKLFLAESPAPLIQAIMTQPMPDLEEIRPDLPITLIDLLYRMLNRDPNARINSVRLVGAELEAILRNDNMNITTTMQTIAQPDQTGRFRATSEMSVVRATNTPQIPNNLPVQPTSFVGRQRELRDIGELLTNSNARLITILGTGGMGKTRVSLAIGEQQLSNFAGGVYFVPLAPLDNAEFIIFTIAEQLKFTFAGSDHLTELTNYLGQKKMLLILDNFEHLMDGADIIAKILQDAPQVKVLVTSRERLRLRGEQVYDLDGMTVPEGNTPEALMEYPSVQLFTQSAQRVMPDFEVDEENTQDVARIIELVQGLPLGIELAAGWLEMLPIDEIVQEIEASLDFLESNLRDVPDRHQSLRAVFEYSWNLLNEDERDIFVNLSIFRGGFERTAVQKVTGTSLKSLTHLINKSLLRRSPEGRYFMHKMLKQFAEELFAESDKQASIRKAHAQYYASMLSKLEQTINSTKEREAVNTIELELENIRLAWKWAVENHQWEIIDQMSFTLTMFYLARSMQREGLDSFAVATQILAQQGQENSITYWRLRSYQAWMGGRIGEYEILKNYSSQASDYFKAQNIPLEMCYALNSRAYHYMIQGDYPKSKEVAEEALDCAHKTNDTVGLMMSLGNLGYTEYLMGNLTRAREIYQDVIQQIPQRNYSLIGHGYSLNNLGEIVWRMGDLKQAQKLFEEAYEIFKSSKQNRGMAFSLNNMAGVVYATGDYDSAWNMYEEAYLLNKEVGDPTGIGHSLSALGNVALHAEDYETASVYFRQSLETRRSIGDQRGIADSLSDLAKVELAQTNFDEAIELFTESSSVREKINDYQGLLGVLGGIAISHLLQNDDVQAQEVLAQIQEVVQQLDDNTSLAQVFQDYSEIPFLSTNHPATLQRFHDELGISPTES